MLISALLDARRYEAKDVHRGTVLLMGMVAAGFLQKRPVCMPLAWAMDSSVILHCARDKHFRHLVRDGHIRFGIRDRSHAQGTHESVLSLLQETLVQKRHLWGWGLMNGVHDEQRELLLAVLSNRARYPDIGHAEIGQKLEDLRDLDRALMWLPNRPRELGPEARWKELLTHMPNRLRPEAEFHEDPWVRKLEKAVRKFSQEVADGTFRGTSDRTQIGVRIEQLCDDPDGQKVFLELLDEAAVRRAGYQMGLPCHWSCQSEQTSRLFMPEPEGYDGTIGVEDDDLEPIRVSWSDVRDLVDGERGNPREIPEIAAALHARTGRISFVESLLNGTGTATRGLSLFHSLAWMAPFAVALAAAAMGVKSVRERIEAERTASKDRVIRLLGGITKASATPAVS